MPALGGFMKLSQRLSALANLVEPGTVIADIGSDHGYLPIYLVQAGISPKAIAADVNQKPIAVAKRNIEEFGLKEQIETRLGNGLQVLREKEVDCITIAGMGGSLMVEILDASPNVVSQLKRMILQPNIGAELIRRWCQKNNWKIIAEDLIYEDDHYYEVLALEHGEASYTFAEEIMGPMLLAQKHRLLGEYLTHQKEKDDFLLQCLAKSTSEESREKEKFIRDKWNVLEEEYQCRF